MASCGENKTIVRELIVLGFGDLQQFKSLIFVLLVKVYAITLTGNMLIIILVSLRPRLQSPMYFFLCNLSACEILFTSIIMPNMLYIVWLGGAYMSFYGCITQLYFGASAGIAECLLLTVMAYDRYLAICYPLRYSSLMNNRTRNLLTVWAWLSGFIVMTISTAAICHLQFCGLNTIDHLFCDLAPILHLSSSDTSLVEMEALLITIIMSFFPFVLIILSYVFIFWTILKMSSKTGRQKTFSTCSSHLTSVCIFFGTIFIIYLVPSKQSSFKVNKLLSLLYTIVTPLANPMIYSLRNEEMKSSFQTCFLPAIGKKQFTNMAWNVKKKNLEKSHTNNKMFMGHIDTNTSHPNPSAGYNAAMYKGN